MGSWRICELWRPCCCGCCMLKILRRQDKYIPPKKAYSFEAMLNDLLEFAAQHLVDDGRLSLWMPTANDEDVELGIPAHPHLELVSVCVQTFNKCTPSVLVFLWLSPLSDSRISTCVDIV